MKFTIACTAIWLLCCLTQTQADVIEFEGSGLFEGVLATAPDVSFSITDVESDPAAEIIEALADNGTTISNGTLELYGNSQESVHLENSTLKLRSRGQNQTEIYFGGTFTLNSSTLVTFGDNYRFSEEVFIIEKPVVLDGGLNQIESDQGRLRLDGGIIGHGDLLLKSEFDFPIEMAGKIQHTGDLEIRGPVFFTTPNAYSGNVLLVNSGRIYAESPQTFGLLTTHTEKDRASCCNTFGGVIAGPNSSIIADSIQLKNGLIQGNVLTSGPIRFHGFGQNSTISNLESGVGVEVYGGELTIDDSDTSRLPTTGTVSVMRTSEASIVLPSGSVTDADIHLNNGSGFNFGGALRGEPRGTGIPTTVRGDMNLGADGAYIGGSNTIRVEGQIRGGDLHLSGTEYPRLSLVGGPAAYTGKTRIHSGILLLSELGTLTNTESIDIFASGSLYVANSILDGQISDRVADGLQVTLHGGTLKIWPTEWGVDTTERLGTVVLERGQSSLGGTHFYRRGSIESSAELVVGELVRNPGSLLFVSRGDPGPDLDFARNEGSAHPQLSLENPPPVVNGILPVWIRSGRSQFATLGPSGVESFGEPKVTLDVADATSNVRPGSLDGVNGLIEDKEINSFNAFGNAPAVNLNGHTLTIGSGGLIGAELSNGTILPGGHANGELVIATDFVIDANIADNGGPTSVIYSGDGSIGGVNTYSGTTYVTGEPGDDVFVTKASALPTGGDIEISGRTGLFLRDLSGNTVYQLGMIAIRDGGSLTSQCCDLGDTVTADEILLEEGLLAVPLIGNTTVTKNTTAMASLSLRNANFSGRVDVNDGTLEVRGQAQAQIVVHPNGRLVVGSAPSFIPQPASFPNITLAGGVLLGSSLPGSLEVIEDSRIYLLSQVTANPQSSNVDIAGKIHIRSGKSLSVIGLGELKVTNGFQFEPDSVLAGTGSILANIVISGGAILSPGLLSEGPHVGTLKIEVAAFVNDLDDSSLTWGEKGRYRWEINDTDGFAGAPFGEGWDLVNAGIQLIVDATPENPFVIEIVGLDTEGDLGLVEGLQTNVNYHWRIAEISRSDRATIDGFDPAKFLIDVSQLRQFYPYVSAADFSLERNGTGIYLNGFVAVPEPGTVGLMLIGIVGLIGTRRRSRLRC